MADTDQVSDAIVAEAEAAATANESAEEGADDADEPSNVRIRTRESRSWTWIPREGDWR